MGRTVLRAATQSAALLVPLLGCAPSPPSPPASAIISETPVPAPPTSSPAISTPTVSPTTSPVSAGRLGYDWSIDLQPGSLGMPIGLVFAEPGRVLNIHAPSRTLWASEDGVDWHQIPGQITAAFAAADPSAPVRLKDHYFSITGACGEEERSAIVWESVDLLDWRRAASLPRLGLKCVNPGGDLMVYRGQLIAVAMLTRGESLYSYEARPVVWRSTDGQHWTIQPLEPWSTTSKGTDVSLFEGHGAIYLIHYATRSGGATLWRSVDGRHWRRSQTNVHEALPHHVVATGRGFVAIALGNRPSIIVSSNARVWRHLRLADVAGDWVDLIQAHQTLMALAIDFSEDSDTEPSLRSFWVSSDGRDWSRASRISTYLGPAVWFHDHVIVLSTDNRAFLSPPIPGQKLAPQG